MEKIKLSNGVEMPQVGYGVYQVEPEECEALVVDAINVGYRMIDTAQAYLNEEAVGSAWRKSGISRDDLFLVSFNKKELGCQVSPGRSPFDGMAPFSPYGRKRHVFRRRNQS